MNTHNEFDDKKSDSDDDFGLPNMDYDPLPSEDPPQGGHDEPYSFADEDDDEGGSNTPLIVTLVIVFVLLLGGLGYFFVLKPRQEKQRQEQLARQKRNEQRRERERLAQQQREEEMARQKAIADSIAQASSPSAASVGGAVSRGDVTMLDSPTGMYHVVISSALDDDLLRDYAKKLSRQGVSTKIISPYGQGKFHRLVMADDYRTYALAQQKAEQVGGQYQGSAWVLRY